MVNGTPLSTATISSPASVVIGVVSLGTCVTSAKLLVSIGILGCVPARLIRFINFSTRCNDYVYWFSGLFRSFWCFWFCWFFWNHWLSWFFRLFWSNRFFWFAWCCRLGWLTRFCWLAWFSRFNRRSRINWRCWFCWLFWLTRCCPDRLAC